jgi:sugar-specific transcriptional regulator TrmB
MNIENSLEILKDFGLSNVEIQAYITLLKIGASNASTISKEMKIKRTTAYPILERLMERGLISSYEQGLKKIFVPLRPNKLAFNYEKKIESLNRIVPLLEKLSHSESNKMLGVKLIQSKKELEALYTDILNEYKNKEYYIIGSSSAWLNIDRDFFVDYRTRRAKNNTKVKLILTTESQFEEGQDDVSLKREFKYLPEKYTFKSTIDIYDDKILIVGPEMKALCVVIAVPPMVDIFRSIFEILWENL